MRRVIASAVIGVIGFAGLTGTADAKARPVGKSFKTSSPEDNDIRMKVKAWLQPVAVVRICSLEKKAADEAGYNLLYYTAYDKQGHKYDASFTTPDPSLGSGHLGPRECVEGNVGFDVPEGVTITKVDYEPVSFATAAHVRWKVA